MKQEMLAVNSGHSEFLSPMFLADDVLSILSGNGTVRLKGGRCVRS